jgi:hypothetical protein
MSEEDMSGNGVTLQLRRYQLTAETLDGFVRWWREDLLPVRLAYGFQIPFACVSPENAELTWVVGYPGDEAAFRQAERLYNEWPDRLASMSRQPAKPASSSVAFVRNAIPGS